MASRKKTRDQRPETPAKKKPAAKKTGAPAPHAEGKWAEWFDRESGEKRYWLVKSEPSVFSFDDLLRAQNCTTRWDGVRNFAARNFLRDGMKLGDRVFFYHSSSDPQAIVGIAEVVREGYPDATAFDKKSHGYDQESDPAEPQWFAVDLRAVAQFTRPVTLAEIKARKELADMALVRIGRLSVTPVRTKEWETIVKMAT